MFRTTDARWDLALWNLDPDEREGLADFIANNPDLQRLSEHSDAASESSVAGSLSGIPGDWSDRLFLASCRGDLEHLYNSGAVFSAYPHALLHDSSPLGPTAGRIFSDARVEAHSGIPASLMAALLEISRVSDGVPIPYAALTERLTWKSTEEHLLVDLMRRLKVELGQKAVSDIIIAPSLGVGGAEKVAYWHYQLLKEGLGRNPLIVLADKGRIEEKFSDLRTLNLLDLGDGETPFVSKRGLPFLVRCISNLVRCVRPETVHVVQSYAGFGWIEAISAGTVPASPACIFASFFCAHYHGDGVVDGYHLMIPYLEKVVNGYVSDNQYFIDELRKQHGLPEGACTVLRYPAESRPPVQRSRAVDGRRGRVLWAARFDHQKQPQIVSEIARLLPDIDFEMYGESVLGDSRFDAESLPPNLRLGGPFSSFDALPLSAADVFLSTSLFEGLPQALAEASSVGLPIVASAVGGVPEIVTPETGRLVRNPSDPAEYAQAITSLMDPAENIRVRESAYAAALQSRTFESFLQEGESWFLRHLREVG